MFLGLFSSASRKRDIHAGGINRENLGFNFNKNAGKTLSAALVCLFGFGLNAAAVTEVANISEARTLGPGVEDVRIVGEMVVISGTDRLNSGRRQFVVQDSSGAGIVVDDFNANIAATFLEGDVIANLRGKLTEFNGLLQLRPATEQPVLVRTGDPLPEPILIDANSNPEALEATLIRINGADVAENQLWRGDTNYELIAPIGIPYNNIRIENVSSAVNTPIPSGPFDIIGVAWQVQDFIEIWPRFTDDIIGELDDPNFIFIGGDSLNFGSVSNDNTKTLNLAIANEGTTETLTISGATIIGNNPSKFEFTTPLPLNIDPRSIMDAASVVFGPAGAIGSFTAELVLTSNDPTESQFSVALFGSAFDAANAPSGEIFVSGDQVKAFAGITTDTMPYMAFIDIDPTDGSVVALLERANTLGDLASDSKPNGALIDIAPDGLSANILATETEMTSAISDGNDLNIGALAVGNDGTIYVQKFSHTATNSGGLFDGVFSVTPAGIITPLIAVDPKTNGFGAVIVDHPRNRLILNTVRAFEAPENSFVGLTFTGGSFDVLLSEAELLQPGDTEAGIAGLDLDPSDPNAFFYKTVDEFGAAEDRLMRIAKLDTATPEVQIVADGFTIPRSDNLEIGPDGSAFFASAGDINNSDLFIVPAGQSSLFSFNQEDLKTFLSISEPGNQLFMENVDFLASKMEDNTVVLYISNGVHTADTKNGIFKLFLPFLTDATPPSILSGPVVSSVADTSAVIEWTTNELATTEVRFGLNDPPGTAASITGTRIEHSILLTDLSPATVYFVQVVSSDKQGNGPTESGVISFTTDSVPDTFAPQFVEGPGIPIISHNSATVRWKTNEPAVCDVNFGLSENLGSTVSVTEAANLQRVQLEGLEADKKYFVQVGCSDELGNGPTVSPMFSFNTLTAPDTTAPIIVEGPIAVNVTDTTAEIKWTTDEAADSEVSFNNGITFGNIQDDQLVTRHNLLLIGLSPSSTYDYTIFSRDGLGNGPTQVGPLNFTTLAEPDAQAPVIAEGPAVIGLDQTGASIRWVTDEASTSLVEFDEASASTLSRQAASSVFVDVHQIALFNLTPDTDYVYKVASTDVGGNGPTFSPIFTFRTPAEADVDPPVFIEGPDVIDLTDTTATIFWRTDEPSDSVIDYGISPLLNLQKSDPSRVTEHQLTLTNLDPGANYAFVVSSTDAAGNTATSIDASGSGSSSDPELAAGVSQGGFSTKTDPDTTAPSITEGPTAIAVEDTKAIIAWNTDEISDSGLRFGKAGEPLSFFAGSLQRRFEHLVILSNLEPNTSYEFEAASTDISGNQTTSSIQGFTTTNEPDTTAPAFTIQPTDRELDASTALLEWETNELAAVSLTFGTASDRLNRVAGRTGLRKSHQLTLTNLQAGTVYFFKIALNDASGNTTESSVSSFVFSGGPSAAKYWREYE